MGQFIKKLDKRVMVSCFLMLQEKTKNFFFTNILEMQVSFMSKAKSFDQNTITNKETQSSN